MAPRENQKFHFSKCDFATTLISRLITPGSSLSPSILLGVFELLVINDQLFVVLNHLGLGLASHLIRDLVPPLRPPLRSQHTTGIIVSARPSHNRFVLASVVIGINQ